MKIGIIGAGNIGATLARRVSSLGHEGSVPNSRGPETLTDLAQDTGAEPKRVTDIPVGADDVVVMIPMRNLPGLPRDLFATTPELIVIDTCNYYPRQRDGRIGPIENGLTESRWVEQQIGHPVVKAFNNIYAAHLMEKGLPGGAPARIALPVAGDDARAKAVVMDLVEELGFDAVDGGTIDESWRQQPGTPVYAADFDREGVARALAIAPPERPEEFLAA